MGNMQTTIEKDGDGYLAKVKDQPNLFAFAYSEKEAVQELKNVVEMIMINASFLKDHTDRIGLVTGSCFKD